MANRSTTVRPHSAPGLYFKDSVETYSTQSMGITTLGVVGETLRGPAFQSIPISNWKEYQTYFGGTSTAKFKGSQYPKYELPYIAKSYLEQSNQLEVVRVLGLSGVNAGPAWVITATKHKLFTGYEYTIMSTVPEESEEYWAINTYNSEDAIPKAPNVTENNPQYIRAITGYEWHTTCTDCQNIDLVIDLTQGEVVPDANDVPESVNHMKVIQSYMYNKVDDKNPEKTYVTMLKFPEIVSLESAEYMQIPTEELKYDFTSLYGEEGRSNGKVSIDAIEYTDENYSEGKSYVTVIENEDDPSWVGNKYYINAVPTTLDEGAEYELYNEDGTLVEGITITGLHEVEGTIYEYYERVDFSYCYDKVTLYNYYTKIWKSGIQLAEEDYCEGNHNNMVVAVIRSRGEHKKAAFVRSPNESDIANGVCDDIYSYDGIEYYAKNVTLEPSKSLVLGSSCNPGFSATTGDFTIDNYNYGTFTIKVETIDGEIKYYSVSLNPGEKNYIYNVIGGTPEDGDAEIYVEELYDVALRQLIEEGWLNAINSEVVKYPAVNIVPSHADVNDLVLDSVLSKQYRGKRYLYSEELSVETLPDGIQTPILVKYTEDGGLTWTEDKGINGYIYTVFERTNPTTNKKEWFYGCYTEGITYEYNEMANAPEGVVWIECTQSVTDEVQNSFEEAPAYFNNPVSENPRYIRIGDGTNFTYYERTLISVKDSTKKNQKTEYLKEYDYNYDVVANDGKFTNCVKVFADDMFYVNTDGDVYPVTLDFNNYKEQYRYASTPWVVSEIKGSAEQVQLAKLFRFHTISDGNSSSTEIKVSIENIDPSTGKFDVLVRNFNDTDLNTNVIERFVGCTLVPGDSDYIALKIGSFDESYNAVSNYITVEVIESDVTKNSIPAGFLGYPMRNYNGFAIMEYTYKYTLITDGTVPETYTEMDAVPTEVTKDSPNYIKVGNAYYGKERGLSTNPTQPYFKFNTEIDDDIKPKKQYFGVSDLAGIDNDVFSYKGVEAYNDKPEGLTPCFHLDARILNGTPDIDGKITDGELSQIVSVDGVTGYTWVTVNKNNVTDQNIEPRIGSEEVMSGTIYEDKKYRKFTVAFYGGWDGWDYYRTYRSNSNEYRYKDYKGYINSTSGYGDMFSVLKNPEAFDFDSTEKVINSDYYAYLAGVRQFNNPNSIEINVLATPGIDYVNNGQLVNDVIDMVEEERQDCIYVVTTPDKPFGASDSKEDMYTADEAVANLEDSDIDSNHATTYYPWAKYFDADNSEYIYLPVTRDVVRNIAQTDSQGFQWISSSGYTRGVLSSVGPKKKLKLGEQDTLYDGRINFVASFAQDGDRIFGDIDLQIADNQLNRLSTRRLLLRIKKMLQNACIGLLFDPNDNNCSKALRSSVATVLDYVKENRGISDYRIEIDDSASTRDQNGLGVTYWVRRVSTLEWISFTSVLSQSGMEW